jgi:hypothetical protein
LVLAKPKKVEEKDREEKEKEKKRQGVFDMDCVVPGPSVRLFCSALSALGKVGGTGGDLYWEHDAASGLTLRALNGARSAYCSARFRPAFFDRCTTVSRDEGGGEGEGDGGASSTARPHLSVRIAMRALGPVVRPRRDVVQLRITAVFAAAASSTAASPSSRKRKKGTRDTGEGGRPVLRIAFEFLVATKGCGAAGGGGGSSSSPEGSPVLLRAAHCVPVSASRVEPVAAVAPRAGASELACPPRSLLRLLEPLRSLRATEVALLVHRDATALAAQSFHPSDRCHFVPADPSQGGPSTAASGGGGGVQLVLRQPEHGGGRHQASRAARTEASMSVDELDDFYFRDDRGRAGGGGGGDGNGQEDDGGGGGGGDDGSEIDQDDLPEHVNDGVALVFPVREARAFLAFGSAFSRALGPATLRFHWGGRPVVLEVAALMEEGAGAGTAPAFEAQLVLASLDHKLLAVHGGGE